MATDPASPATATAHDDETKLARVDSFSHKSRTSDDSQTAADFIREQELLEADAREALPYSIETCTMILGPLRQAVFACLTCNPAPAKPDDPWAPAGVCYACSVQCHGEHQLVEIFQKRNFTCDCGTTRLPSTSPCTLRVNRETNTKGNVHSEEPDANNKYNQNFQNRFCGCECDYDPFEQKGTMFQCLGLGTTETGGCGEDWYHPGCLVGMGPRWYEKMKDAKPTTANGLSTISEDNEKHGKNDEAKRTQAAPRGGGEEEEYAEEEDPPMPPGFPDEDHFEGFLCYKCIEANPWIKQYAGTDGFLPPIFLHKDGSSTFINKIAPVETSKKRKAEDSSEEGDSKRVKSEDADADADAEPLAGATNGNEKHSCKLLSFGPPPVGRFSLFFKEDFREKLCRCSSCYPRLNQHAQLLEEEEVYEPPMSDSGGGSERHGGSTKGSGSLLERGESALRNVDRVRAIEGVMAYNHLKEQLKPFFQQFAESGKAIGAEDIKAYFAKLRGDEQGIREAGAAAASAEEGDGGDDFRREQGGY